MASHQLQDIYTFEDKVKEHYKRKKLVKMVFRVLLGLVLLVSTWSTVSLGRAWLFASPVTAHTVSIRPMRTLATVFAVAAVVYLYRRAVRDEVEYVVRLNHILSRFNMRFAPHSLSLQSKNASYS